MEPTFSMELCRDKKDDKFIDCAILGRVNYIVSEDHDFIDDETLKSQLLNFNIQIKNAENFYHMIKQI